MGEIAGQPLALYLVTGAQVVDAPVEKDPEHEAGAAVVEAEAQHLALAGDEQQHEGDGAEHRDGGYAHRAVPLPDVLADHEPEGAEEACPGDEGVNGAEEEVLGGQVGPEGAGGVVVLQDGGHIEEVEEEGGAGEEHGAASCHQIR